MENECYLDYNATTPLSVNVKKSIIDTLELWANPSSSYEIGQKASQAIESARSRAIQSLNLVKCGMNLTFTSGGTEANNWVIHSTVQEHKLHQPKTIPHVITTNVEHDSIRCCLEKLEKTGEIEVTYIPVNPVTKAVDTLDVADAIKPNTRLVTVMLANNETGAIQPLQQIARSITTANEARPVTGRVLLHSDIAQALGKISIDFEALCLDFATIVGHKIYGPRIGALLHRNSVPLHPWLYGGGQEKGLRPGTLNTPMVLGLCEAICNAAQDVESVQVELASKRDRLENMICVAAKLLTLCQTFNASTGSACHSGSMRPSKVLLNSGYSEHDALRTVRFSVGTPTKVDQFIAAVDELAKVVKDLSVPQ